MAKTNWQMLIERYADGKPICRCGQAYYTTCGRGYSEGDWPEDPDVLPLSCKETIFGTHEYIAERVMQELETLLPQGSKRDE